MRGATLFSHASEKARLAYEGGSGATSSRFALASPTWYESDRHDEPKPRVNAISIMAGYRFDQDYEETVHLRDGTRARLRPIRASDKQLLLEGFERLSPRSRYTRFLTPKQRLSDRELRYLTEVDGVDHFALVALTHPLFGQEEGIGVGRFVRLADEPDTAEPAITVADDQQAKGLGTVLLHRLSDAAWERGIRQFRCELLADNAHMRDLLAGLETDVRLDHVADGALVVTFPIGAPVPDERRRLSSSVRRALSFLAQELVSFMPRATRHPEERD